MWRAGKSSLFYLCVEMDRHGAFQFSPCSYLEGLQGCISMLEETYRNEELLCMLQNQLACCNLNDFQRVEMVRKCEQAVNQYSL